jgi:hypothetical protein
MIRCRCCYSCCQLKIRLPISFRRDFCFFVDQTLYTLFNSYRDMINNSDSSNSDNSNASRLDRLENMFHSLLQKLDSGSIIKQEGAETPSVGTPSPARFLMNAAGNVTTSGTALSDSNCVQTSTLESSLVSSSAQERLAALREVNNFPKFTGGLYKAASDRRPLPLFREYISQAVRVHDWTPLHEFLLLSHNLETSVLARIVLPAGAAARCAAVWSHLERECLGTLTVGQILNKRNELKQRDKEPTVEFVDRVLAWKRECSFVGEAVSAMEVKFILKGGLRDRQLALATNAFLSLTLDDFINRLRLEAVDRELESSYAPVELNNTTTDSRPRVSQSRQTGNFQRHQQRGSPVNQTCHRCGEDGHFAFNCDAKSPKDRDNRCRKCGSKDHKASACARDLSQIKCRRCQRVGHLSPICLKQERVSGSVNEPAAATATAIDEDDDDLEVNAHALENAGGLLFLELLFEGQVPSKGILDCGATRNFLSLSEYQRLKKRIPSLQLSPTSRQVVFGDGRKSPLLGQLHDVNISYDGTDMTADFYVLPSSRYNFLICLDTLRSVGYSLSGDKQGDVLVLHGGKEINNDDFTHCGVVLDNGNDNDSLQSGQDLEILFVPDIDAPAGRPVVSIPWLGSGRPRQNFHAARVRDRICCSNLTAEETSVITDDLVTNDFAVKVARPGQLKHYIPAMVVKKLSSKTTKLRLVLDAREFNRYVAKGPEMNSYQNSLLTNLLLWRGSQRFVAFDVSKAFWRCRIRDSDQQYLGTIINGVEYMFKSLPFGLSFSPSALGQSFRTILQDVKDIKFTYYVDDFLVLGDDEATVKRDRDAITSKLAEHGFPIADAKTFSNMITTSSLEPTYKQLGYTWHCEGDMISPVFSNEIIAATSRSEVVGALSKLYDPLGLAIEWQMNLRWWMRETISNTKSWTEEVPKALRESVGAAMSLVPTIKVNRQCCLSNINIFTDASAQAMAWIAYDTDFNRIMARGALLPKHQSPRWSAPRLELLAVWRAATDMATILGSVTNMKHDGVHITFYTDSLITLYRLRRISNDRRLPNFEKKRLVDIRNIITSNNWKICHIAGSQNLADSASRPSENMTEKIIAEVTIAMESSIVSYNGIPDSHDETGDEIEDDPFWSFGEYYACNLAAANNITANDETALGNITKMVAESQTLYESSLPKGSSLTNIGECSFIKQSDNILYRRVRTELVDNAVRECLQLVIPSEDKALQQLIISSIHHQSGHRGVQKTRQLIESKFYWKNMRRHISTYVNSCDICQKLRSSRYWNKAVGVVQWPGDNACLAVLGLDLTGPYKSIQTINGSKQEVTIYGLVGICAVSKFMMASPISDSKSSTIIRKLVEWRGVMGKPTAIVTDHGSHFNKSFSRWCSCNNIQHLFIPVYSPSRSFWERPHRDLHAIMRAKLIENPDADVGLELSMAAEIYNSTPYDESSPLSPVHLVLTFDPNAAQRVTDPDFLNNFSPPEFPDLQAEAKELQFSYSTRMKEYFQIWLDRRERTRSQLIRKAGNRHDIEVGDQVIRWRPRRSKLNLSWQGPFRVAKVNGGRIVILTDKGEVEESSLNLKKYIEDNIVEGDSSPLELSDSDSSDGNTNSGAEDIDVAVDKIKETASSEPFQDISEAASNKDQAPAVFNPYSRPKPVQDLASVRPVNIIKAKVGTFIVEKVDAYGQTNYFLGKIAGDIIQCWPIKNPAVSDDVQGECITELNIRTVSPFVKYYSFPRTRTHRLHWEKLLSEQL